LSKRSLSLLPFTLAAILLTGGSCVSPRSEPMARDAGDDGEAMAENGLDGAVDGGADGATDLAGPNLDGATPGTLDGASDTASPPDAPPPVDVGPASDAQADSATPLLAVGRACKSDGQCGSNHCADEVCCATACTGKCNACASASTGLPDGTCGPALAGVDPHDECGKSAQTCGTDGTCDGKGQCRFAAFGLSCGAETCTAGTYTPPSACDGKGLCATPDPISCGTYPCSGSKCSMSCSASLPCPSPSLYCDSAGKCQAKKSSGGTCNGDGECATGHCAEGVCCNTACGTQCRSCLAVNTGSADGLCAPVKNGFDPYDQCQATAPSSCLDDGACNGAGACRKHAQNTPCRSASCTDGTSSSTAKPAGVCNGSGLCVDSGTGGGCGLYMCGGTQCKMTCASTGECYGNNYYCDGTSHCAACPRPSATNLLANPGFDQNLGSWQITADFGADALRNSLDRDTCRSSGSLEMRFGDSSNVIASQCIAGGDGSYNFGGAFLASSVPEAVLPGGVPWQAICSLRFYGSMTDCATRNGQLAQKSIDLQNMANTAGQWLSFGLAWFAPLGTKAVMFECDMLDDGAPVPTYILLDKLYLSASGGTY
jgi:hypothetical protein